MTTTPTLANASLLRYVQEIEAKYPNAEFYKQELPDSGRDEGPTLGITVCENDEILEEENFYYNSHNDLVADLKNLVFYLEFS